jgi:hypothetical protein
LQSPSQAASRREYAIVHREDAKQRSVPLIEKLDQQKATIG